MMKPLVLIGGGGHCRSVIEAAESAGRVILGVLDVPERVGEQVLGYKIVGTDGDVAAYASTVEFVITVGHIRTADPRREIDRKINEAGGKWATIIASTAHVSRHARVGEGTVVLHGAMVNAGAHIGRHTIVNTLANVEHDARIGDFCHLSTGSMVNGDCRVEDDVFLGSQSVLFNGISVCEGAAVGAGSVVRESIRQGGVYCGNPAVWIKKR